MNKFALHFDRSFSTSYFKQIFWLIGVVVLTLIALLLLGLIPSFYELGIDVKGKGLFWDVFYQFMDQRIRSGNFSSAYSLLIDLAGIAVINCLFISVLISMFSRRTKLYENGQVRYSMENHFIIIGHNKLSVSLIRYLHKKNPDAFILLFTSKDVSSVRKAIGAELTKDEKKSLIYYSGDQTIAEDMQTLQADKCLEMYIIGEDRDASDTLNVESLNVLYSILKKAHPDHRVRCYVKFSQPDIYTSFQYADISEDMRNYISFVPFTFEDVWAQKVLIHNHVGIPIDSKDGIQKNSDQHVHVIINGMTPMGIALALQTARIAHFPNANLKNPNTLTHITFIDKNASKKMHEFKHHYSHLFDLSDSLFWNSATGKSDEWHNPIDTNPSLKYLAPNFLDVRWEFIEGELSDVPVHEYLAEVAKDTTAYVSIFNCQKDCEQNIVDAMNMSDNIYTAENVLHIYVQQELSTSVVKMLSASSNSKFAKMSPFGMLDDVFQNDLVSEHLGKKVNAHYCGVKDFTKQEEIDDLWNQLPISHKWSSINSANMCYVHLRSIGFKENMSKDELQQLIDRHMDEMMHVEHNRWNMDKLLSGYRALTESESLAARKDPGEKKRLRSSPYYAHLDICSFELLEQIDFEVCKYDVDVLRVIPDIIF